MKLTEASRSDGSMLQKCVTVVSGPKWTEASRSERSMLQKCDTVEFCDPKNWQKPRNLETEFAEASQSERPSARKCDTVAFLLDKQLERDCLNAKV